MTLIMLANQKQDGHVEVREMAWEWGGHKNDVNHLSQSGGAWGT